MASFTGTTKERGTTLVGRVAEIGKDGKSFTIEVPGITSRGRDEDPKPPTKVAIQISGKTRVYYNGVGTGEANPLERFGVQVKLDETNKEAWDISFSKPGAERSG
jgi:hypothetical protein